MEGINKKIQNILSLSNDDKYEYFIRKITDFEEIWGLFDNGWAILGDNKGETVFPFWPEEIFAQLNAIDQWNGYKPESIDLETFINIWIPGMKRDGVSVCIFYSVERPRIVKTADTLLKDINCELEQYE